MSLRLALKATQEEVGARWIATHSPWFFVSPERNTKWLCVLWSSSGRLPQPSAVTFSPFHVIGKHHGIQLHSQKKCTARRRNNTGTQRPKTGKASLTLPQLRRHGQAQRIRQKAKQSCDRHLQACSFPTGVKLSTYVLHTGSDRGH